MSKAISSLMDNSTLDVATTTFLALQDTYNLDPVDLSRGEWSQGGGPPRPD